jgi:hypothetical protein
MLRMCVPTVFTDTDSSVAIFGEQRGVRGLVPRQGLEELPRSGHREREHEPVSFGESQGPFG